MHMYRPFNAFSMHMQSCKALIYSHIQNIYNYVWVLLSSENAKKNLSLPISCKNENL